MTFLLRFLPLALLALAPLRLHKGRAFASLLAISLGVAMGYAIQIINRAALAEMEQAVQTLSGAADLEVRGPRTGFVEALYAQLARRADVAVASPVLELELRIADGKPRVEGTPPATLRVLGLDAFRAGQIQPELLATQATQAMQAMQSGAQSVDSLDMLRPDTLFLSPAAANPLGLKPGDTLALRAGLGEHKFRVAGLLASGGERYAVMDIAAAQEVFGVTATGAAPGLINRIDIRLRPGADAQRVREVIAATLPAGLFIEAPRAKLTRDLVCAVAGAVGSDNHLQAILRIIQRQSVFQLGSQSALLVISGDNYGDSRSPISSAHCARAQTADDNE